MNSDLRDTRRALATDDKIKQAASVAGRASRRLNELFVIYFVMHHPVSATGRTAACASAQAVLTSLHAEYILAFDCHTVSVVFR